MRRMRSKVACLVLVVCFMGAGSACGGEEVEEPQLPTSPLQEGGEEQEQEGGQAGQEEGGGD